MRVALGVLAAIVFLFGMIALGNAVVQSRESGGMDLVRFGL